MVQAIIIGGESHLLGHIVEAKAEGVSVINGKRVMLYTTTPAKYKVGGNKPIWFQEHHLSFAPAQVDFGAVEEDKRDKTIHDVPPVPTPFQWNKL